MNGKCTLGLGICDTCQYGLDLRLSYLVIHDITNALTPNINIVYKIFLGQCYVYMQWRIQDFLKGGQN